MLPTGWDVPKSQLTEPHAQLAGCTHNTHAHTLDPVYFTVDSMTSGNGLEELGSQLAGCDIQCQHAVFVYERSTHECQRESERDGLNILFVTHGSYFCPNWLF